MYEVHTNTRLIAKLGTGKAVSCICALLELAFVSLSEHLLFSQAVVIWRFKRKEDEIIFSTWIGDI